MEWTEWLTDGVVEFPGQIPRLVDGLVSGQHLEGQGEGRIRSGSGARKVDGHTRFLRAWSSIRAMIAVRSSSVLDTK